mgnify:CR=1 FL=1
MKRDYLIYIGYDKKKTKIPLSSDKYWFSGSRGNSHCVVSCLNFSECFYITDFGYCSISYCDAHAETRILSSMLSGELQRGIWCTVEKGKVKPHWYYKRYMPFMEKANLKQALKLKRKLNKIANITKRFKIIE